MATKTVSIEHISQFLTDVANLNWLNKEVYEAIGEELLTSTHERFDNQESPDGTKWAALSKQHQDRKQKRDYGDKILEMRGHLKNTLRYQATSTSVKFGSDRDYAALHQFGGRFKAFGKHDAIMPARPFIGLSDADKIAIREVLQDAWDAWSSDN